MSESWKKEGEGRRYLFFAKGECEDTWTGESMHVVVGGVVGCARVLFLETGEYAG